MIPAFVYMYLMNPFDIEWYWNNINLFAAYGCKLKNLVWIPRVWYWRGFNYRPRRLFLLRGGKVLKIEH